MRVADAGVEQAQVVVNLGDRPVARSVSPIFAALMKLSLRSKLIARVTGG
jgi:hypothetical protein